MATIQVQITNVTPEFASAEVAVSDGRATRPYYVFAAAAYVTVVAGVPDRRKVGRTFHSDAELAAHYKRDGRTLVEVVTEMRKAVADRAKI